MATTDQGGAWWSRSYEVGGGSHRLVSVAAGVSDATDFERGAFLSGLQNAIHHSEEKAGRGYDVSTGPEILTVRAPDDAVIAIVRDYCDAWNRSGDEARAFRAQRDAQRVEARCPCCGFFGRMDLPPR